MQANADKSKFKRIVKLGVLLAVAPSGAFAQEIPPLIPPEAVAVAETEAPTFSMTTPAITELLRVWNKPDRNGVTCAHCHATPNAVEFALVGVDVTDITRRGLEHHPIEEIRKVFEGVEELKALYKIAPRDRNQKFLLQPGGTPVEGATPIEKDFRWMQEEMVRTNPSLLQRIDTLEQAGRAYEEFLTNTRKAMDIRVPFVSPLYSGDTFRATERGEPTGTIHKWISELPIMPLNDAAAAEIAARRDAYMAKPSNLNFFNYFYAVSKGTGVFGQSYQALESNPALAAQFGINFRAAGLEIGKYQSALIAFHAELQDALGMPSFMNRSHMPLKLGLARYQKSYAKIINPFQNEGDATGAPLGTQKLIYPPFVLARKPDFIAMNETTINWHADLGGPLWWSYSMLLDPAREEAPAAYWMGDLTEFGETWIPGREGTPGYPGFFSWLFLRAGILSTIPHPGVPHSARFSNPHFGFVNGLNRAGGAFNATHRKLLQTVVLNGVKLHMWSYIDYVTKMIAAGQKPHIPGADDVPQFFEMADQYLQGINEPEELAALTKFRAWYFETLAKAQAFPASATPAPAAGTGLTASYFDGPGFLAPTGKENVLGRVAYHQAFTYDPSFFDTLVYHSLGNDQAGTPRNPAPQQGQTGFSVRWEGELLAPYSDTFRFWLITPRQSGTPWTKARVFLNGNLAFEVNGSIEKDLLQYWSYTREAPPQSLPVTLVAGQRYQIRVEYENLRSEDLMAVLMWRSATYQPMDIVAARYLYPAEAASVPPPRVYDWKVPDAFTGVPYSYALQTWGGAEPLSFRAETALPPGVTLSPAGVLSGTPTGKDPVTFTVRLTDARGAFDLRTLRLAVRSGASPVYPEQTPGPSPAPVASPAPTASPTPAATPTPRLSVPTLRLAGPRVVVTRSARAVLRGTATHASAVTATVGTRRLRVSVTADGSWRVVVPVTLRSVLVTLQARGPAGASRVLTVPVVRARAELASRRNR